MQMDNIDKRLVSILLHDGRRSLSDMKSQLGISHVAIGKRLEKLLNEDVVRVTTAVNLRKLDAKLLFIAIETENSEVAERIVHKYADCPRLVMLAPVTGRYNLFAIMIAEDVWSLESTMGTCSLRTEPGVRKSETWFGNAPLVPTYMPLDLAPGSGKREAPCGKNCSECKRYTDDKCSGCPATSHYRGVLWRSPMTEPRRRSRKKS